MRLLSYSWPGCRTFNLYVGKIVIVLHIGRKIGVQLGWEHRHAFARPMALTAHERAHAGEAFRAMFGDQPEALTRSDVEWALPVSARLAEKLRQKAATPTATV